MAIADHEESGREQGETGQYEGSDDQRLYSLLTSVHRNELARFVLTALYFAHFPESNEIAFVEYGETVPDPACAVDVMGHNEDRGFGASEN